MTDERPDILRAALDYRKERERTKARLNGPEPKNEEVGPLPTICAAMRKGLAKPRLFLDSGGLIPLGDVFLLSGDGGVGKSLLALQLAIACTTGTQWLGMDVAQGAVLYFSAEDKQDELDRRLNEICEAEGVDLATAFTLHTIPRLTAGTVLAVEDKGRIVPTKLFFDLERTVSDYMPVVLTLDNLADIFAGNENNRMHVQQFATLLRGLAERCDVTILLLAHPSLAGMASGTGLSGNTQWNNSFRARGYMHKPDDEDADENMRVVEIMKSNYGPSGRRLNVRWKDHRFVAAEVVNPWDRVTVRDLEKVRDMFATGKWRVSEQASDWGGYAVAQVLDIDVGRGVAGREQRTAEQNRNRDHVKVYLNGWLRSKQIFIVSGKDASRRPAPFFSNHADDPEGDEGLIANTR